MIVAQKNQIREMYEKNLKYLTPWLKESVAKIDEPELWEKIEVTYNDKGYPICRYHQGGTSFLITSESPAEEAEAWGKDIAAQGTGAIFLFGAGFGYSIYELFVHKKPDTLVIVFEQDIYLFKAMLHYFDFEPIFQTQKIAFFVGECEYFANAFERLITSINTLSCTYPTIAFSLAAQRNFKAQYLKIHKYIFSQLSLLVFYIGNDHYDDMVGFQNILANAKEIMLNPHLSCLKDKYKSYPAFIIANGPSLDKNIQQLKDIQGRGLIISVESAIIPLMKNDIKPDVLTVIERTRASYTCHFQSIDYPDDIALLSLAVVDKNICPSFPGPKALIFRSCEAINIWANEYLGDESAIDAGSNVSHLALEIAAYLGADPIVFVGQDLAYGPDSATHSKASVYYEDKGKRARERIETWPIVYVEGNDGTMLPTHELWVDFKKGLERKIAVHTEKVFLNATEGGAKIEGTTCERLEDVIKRYCVKAIPSRVSDLLNENKETISLSDRRERIKDFIKSAEKYTQSFRELVLDSITGRLRCREMLRLTKEKVVDKAILKDAYQKNMNAFNKLTSDFLFICFTQQLLFAYYYQINRLGSLDWSEANGEIFKIHFNFFSHLNVICQSVAVHMENAVEQLNRLLEDLNDSEGDEYEKP